MHFSKNIERVQKLMTTFIVDKFRILFNRVNSYIFDGSAVYWVVQIHILLID